jgi:lipopolysaccharide export LptBFGC system permease protein LptF
MKIKAILDPETIAAWQLAAAGSQQKFKLVFASLFMALLCLGFGIFLHNIYVFGLFFVIAFIALAANAVIRLNLACPHCAQYPLTPFVLSSPSAIEFCPHCFYWLKSPW